MADEEIDIVIRSTDKSKGAMQSAQKNVDRLEKSLQKTTQTTNKTESSYSKYQRRMKKMQKEYDEQVAKAKKVSRSQRTMSEGAEDLSKRFNKLSKVSTLVKTAFIGIIGSGIVGYMDDLASEAADAAESFSKAQTIFGQGYAEMEQWANSSAQSLGLSKHAALDASSSFGNMYLQLGFTNEEAQAMSKQMVALASDMGSFHNADITSVIEAQESAFRGEYDALQRYVPTISAANIQKKALAMTGKDSAKSLTDQEKAAAAYSFMIENAGDATGDFARTSDGAVNQQRIANAEMENARVLLGTKLIPAKLLWARIMSKAADFIATKLVPGIQKLVSWLKENQTVVKVVAGFIVGALVPSFVSWAVSAGAAAAATLAAVSPIALLIGAVVALAVLIFAKWDAIKEKTGAALEFIANLFTSAWDAIKLVAVEALLAIVQFIVDRVQEGIEVWEFLKSSVLSIWDAIKSGIKSVLDWIWDNTIGRLNSLSEKVSEFSNSVKSAFGFGGSQAKRIGNGLLKKARSTISSISRYATGGTSSGGIAVVGEAGQEIVELAAGDRVRSAATPNFDEEFQSGMNEIHIHVNGSILSENDLQGVIKRALMSGAYAGLV